MVSQSVLLRGVNDNAATLEALMRAFVECRIKPYYLHHGDLAPGTAHLRTTLVAGRNDACLARAGVGTMPAGLRDRYSRWLWQGAGGPNYLSKVNSFSPESERDAEPAYRIVDYCAMFTFILRVLTYLG